MYDVVKNDPKYMQRNYKATPNNIQNIMSNNQGSNEYVPFGKVDDDDDSDQDLEDNLIVDRRR